MNEYVQLRFIYVSERNYESESIRITEMHYLPETPSGLPPGATDGPKPG